MLIEPADLGREKAGARRGHPAARAARTPILIVGFARRWRRALVSTSRGLYYYLRCL
jgi:hypothetical protein